MKQVSKIFDRNLSREEVKALNNWVKNKDLVIQKAGKDNDIVILKGGEYISKLSKILEDISKFKRVWNMEERTICLLKGLEDQGDIKKEKQREKWFISIRF